ncbi:unnamed protein product [Alopecurus aequalis]
MQPGGTTAPSAGAALALAGAKATSASPSVVSAKPTQAPAGAVGGGVLAVDAKRSATTLAAVVGRHPAFSDDDHLKPKGLSAERIKTMAEETSSLLGRICLPKQSTIAEQACFSKEVEALQKACIGLVEGAGCDDVEGALNMLLGVHARINLLLLARGRQSPEELLLSSMAENKSSVKGYIVEQDEAMADAEADGRSKLYKMVAKVAPFIKLQPCSDDEVKEVLQKTLALLESVAPTHSPTSMPSDSALFYKNRSECRAYLEDVEKNGVHSMTGIAVKLIHGCALFDLLGRQHKYIDEHAADDSLPSSLRRLELGVREYLLGGGFASSQTTD